MACIRGLTSFVDILFSSATTLTGFTEFLPPAKYHAAVAGILRQGVERLDNVRQVAGESILHLLQRPLPAVLESNMWCIEGHTLMKELFLRYIILYPASLLHLRRKLRSDDENDGWKDGAWLFPRVIKLLGVSRYRTSILTGLVASVGTKTDNTVCSPKFSHFPVLLKVYFQRAPVSSSLVAYARALPIQSDHSSSYGLTDFVLDLINHAKSNITSNAIVVPVLQTFNILVEGDALNRLDDNDKGLRRLALDCYCGLDDSDLPM